MVGCGDLFHSPNPVSITLTTPQAINEQLIHVNPGHAQPLHNQPSLVELPRTVRATCWAIILIPAFLPSK